MTLKVRSITVDKVGVQITGFDLLIPRKGKELLGVTGLLFLKVHVSTPSEITDDGEHGDDSEQDGNTQTRYV